MSLAALVYTAFYSEMRDQGYLDTPPPLHRVDSGSADEGGGAIKEAGEKEAEGKHDNKDDDDDDDDDDDMLDIGTDPKDVLNAPLLP